MLAELRGKLDVTKSTGASRLEDTLTDAVFAAFRYLPKATALSRLLHAFFPQVGFSSEEVSRARVELWPRLSAGTEPDVMLTVGRWLILVEAKYRSGFGIDADRTHQLEREWRHGRDHAAARKLKGPLIVAVTDDPRTPAEIHGVREALEDAVVQAAGFSAADAIRWVPWQSLARILEDMRGDVPGEQQELIDDVLAVMQSRGVRRMFEGLNRSDYWLIAAAREAAEQRFYPAISEFTHELIGLLEDDNISWGGGDSGLWMYYSHNRGKPSEWPLAYVTLPFWPDTWPRRIKYQAALVCTFSLREPVISIGYGQMAKTQDASSKHWAGAADELAESLRTLPDRYEIAIDDSYAKQTNIRRPEEVDADWISDSCRIARCLWILERFGVDEVTETETARQALTSTRDAVGSLPAVFDSLLAAGLIEPTSG